jgi:DNA-binding HxlR family transcriptional regulator
MRSEFRSHCPVASALDILGDRWTLLVLRMLFAGRKRYAELLKMPEKIATNILAQRLALLQEEGLIAARAYQPNPARYEYALTEKGADLLPVLQALSLWGVKHIPQRWTPPAKFMSAKPDDYYPMAIHHAL